MLKLPISMRQYTSLHIASLRFVSRHPWQFGLSILSIALGVAVIVAVDLANESARRGFALSMDMLTGKASHQIIGGPGGIPEQVYADLRIRHKTRPSAPVVEGLVRIRGETFRLLGLDPFAEGPFRELTEELAGGDFGRLYAEPDTVLMAGISARRLQLRPGDAIELVVGGRRVPVTLLGLIDNDNAAAIDGLLVADIATAQELLDRVGVLDRIDLVLEPGAETSLRGILPVGLDLQTASSRRQATSQLSGAFHTNLTAMSLLAILVGGFLIYNTLTFSVLQRRRLLAIKRMLGMTQGQLFGLVLKEALVLGLIGTLLGLLLGWALGHGMVRLVTRTINDLYFVLTVTEMLPTPWSFLKGTAVGLTASLVAALGPAWEAAGISPIAAQRRSVLEGRTHRMVRWLAAGGCLAMAAGLALVQLAQHSLINGFVALFMIVVGYSLLVPLAVLGIIRLPLGPARRLFGPLGQLASRGIGAGLSRTGLTIAALTLAISATVGVAILISSFRATVAAWLEQTLQSDIYVSARGSVSSRADGSLDPFLIERLRELPHVTGLSTGRRVEVNTETDPVGMIVLAPGPQSRRGFSFKPGPPQMWQRFLAGEVVLISEPLSYHRALEPRDQLRLLTDRKGYQAFEIGGVFRDYGSSRGTVLISRGLYDRFWNDPHVSSVGLQLADAVDPDQALARVRETVAELGQTVLVRFNRAIREVSLGVFDRTFAITHVLRLLTITVAFIGIISALMAIQLEQRRDHAVLRATGVTPGQLFALVLMQTGLMGLIAGLLALPIGWLMSQMLIHVINLRAFGWSMQSLLPLPVLGEAMLLSLSAALLAGLYPAYRMARVSPAAALREE